MMRPVVIVVLLYFALVCVAIGVFNTQDRETQKAPTKLVELRLQRLEKAVFGTEYPGDSLNTGPRQLSLAGATPLPTWFFVGDSMYSEQPE